MRRETANILSILDEYTIPSTQDTAIKIAEDFRKRRIEKGFTREYVAKASGVPLGTVARFEQKGLISLKNLIQLANVSGYLSELKNIFSEPKFSTIEELEKIRKNSGKKKAYKSQSCNNPSHKNTDKND